MNKRHNRRRKKKKKPNKPQKKKHQTNRNSNIDDILMKGFVSLQTGKKLWSMLIGNVLYFYHSNTTAMPFDAINLSRFDKAEESHLGTGQNDFLWFGIRLFKKNGNETDYLYSDSKERRKWFKLLSSRIRIKHKDNTNTNFNDNDNIINIFTASAMCLAQNQNNDTFLLCDISLIKIKSTKNNQFEIRYRDKIIDLSNYERIELISTPSAAKGETLFKYGIRIMSKSTNHDLKFLTKSNNNRMEFFCHLHEIINEKSMKIISVYDEVLHENENKHAYDAKDQQPQNIRNQNDICDNKRVRQQKENIEQKQKTDSRQCGNCSKNDVSQRCSGCKVVYYCNSQCQSAHWKKHKKKCKLLRARSRAPNNLTANQHRIGRIDEKTQKRVTSKFVINTSFEESDIDDPQSNDTINEHFAFGENFVYNDCFSNLRGRVPHFIVLKYSTLKEELLENPYFKISNEEYLDYFIEAYRFKCSPHFKNSKSKWRGADNIDFGIEEGSNLSINHIICLLTYCNNDALQREFKKHCRKRNKNESNKQLNERHSFVANWRKYLFECTVFYGETMKAGESFYCGVDYPLLFDGFRAMFSCPLSTTLSLTVANNFATNTGIILKLQAISSGQQNLSMYFNVEKLSHYPYERERLFVSSSVKIVDIIMNGESNSAIISSFELLELILRGNIFLKQPANDVQLMMLKFSKNYVMKRQNDDYFQKMFNNTINSYFSASSEHLDLMFINQKQLELSLTNKELFGYFLRLNNFNNKEKYVPGLLYVAGNTKRKVRVRIIKQIGIVVLNKKQVRRLQNRDAMVESSTFTVDFNLKHLPFFLAFQFEARDDSYHCLINLQSLPSHVREICIFYDIICKELKFEQIQFRGNLSAREPSIGYPAFARSALFGIKSLTFSVNVRAASYD